MLVREFRGQDYNKAEMSRRIAKLLNGRSRGSIEFKRCNISAVLNEIGFPFIPGYKPRSNYQDLLYEVVVDRVFSDESLRREALIDADRPIAMPSIDDVLAVLTAPPVRTRAATVRERSAWRYGEPNPNTPRIDYLQREARNAALGSAGEEFVLRYETARLLNERRETLAARITHVSRSWGDGVGFDILSFDTTGAEKLIEVKTTKYGAEAPFYVSENELRFSEANESNYHLYRLFAFRKDPRLFTLCGPLSRTCDLMPNSYSATSR